MFRLFLIMTILLFNLTPTPAEEQVKETYKLKGQVEYDDNPVEVIYLDDDVEKPEVNIPQRTLTLPARVLNITSNTNTSRSALARAMVNRGNLADILPLNESIASQCGGLTYGTTFGEAISNSQMESTTSFFVRYDLSKKFAFTTSLRQSANRDFENQYGTIRYTPEWHITDKLTLKDSFTNYVSGQKNKNEITIVYTPALKKYADALKFELSVAQSYYASGKQSSGVAFSTGFRL